MKKFLLLISVFVSFCAIDSSYAQDTILLSNNLRLIKDCDSYILDYVPVEILYDTIEYNNDYYFRAKFADMSYVEYTEDVGYPEIPIYSISLQFPLEDCYAVVTAEPFLGDNVINLGGTSPSNEAFEEPSTSASCISLPDSWLYYPTQGCVGNNTCTTDIDQDFYYYYDTLWMHKNYYYDTIPGPFMNFGSITFNILPLHYNPEDHCMRQMSATRFTITTSCCADLCEMQEETLLNPVFGQDAAIFFDNYTEDEYIEEEAAFSILDYPDEANPEYETLNTTYKGDYLIIVQDVYANEMEDFKIHKIYYGYHVEVLTRTQAIANGIAYANSHNVDVTLLSIADIIRYAIKDKKENKEYLKYVLLVSEEGVIPVSAGLTFVDWEDNDMTNPPTDIFYESLNDRSPRNLYLMPELYVGRWIITNSLDLANIIQKTITTEISFYSKHIAFFSGTGDMENMFYSTNTKIAQNIVANSNITITNIDGRSLPLYTPVMNTELQTYETWMWVYNGHGNINIIGSPYMISAQDIINNDIFCPFGFGFACLLNTYRYISMGARLLRSSEDYGTATYYGASTESYGLCNKKLNKRVFKDLTTNTKITIGQMITIGELKYYDPCKTSVYKQRTIKMYNLFGDPSLPLHGYDDETGLPLPFMMAPKYIPEEDAIVLNTTFYDITGKAVFPVDSDITNTSKLFNGLYIKVKNTTEGILSEKMIINNY